MSAADSSPSADRNLLFGILALQMDFISREALIQAMNAWVLQKATPLGQILLDQGALRVDTHALLQALVQKHLEMHGGDAQKSLASVSSLGSARQQLQQIADADLHQSLAHVAAHRAGQDDPFATQPPTVGEPTSSGLRFRILRPYAEGGLGKVFVARDEELGREVALKEIKDRHADDPDKRLRFLLEAEITGGLEHPSIVPVYGLGKYADGRPFYAMRFIRGDSLQDAIARFHHADSANRDAGERTLALRELLGRFLDVCNATAYAHARGILHRDLKPGNVMLGKYGETLVVDWGLAKPLGRVEAAPIEPMEGPLQPSSACGSVPTQIGSAIGTPAYMPPEQAAGRLDQLGPASDVYSLGATLYCLLTGLAPFAGDDVGAVLGKVQRGEFRPPRQVKPAVPAALEAVCLKAMALRPEERYASPRALAEDIEHWLADEPVSAYRESPLVRLGRLVRRHRTQVVAGMAALLVAVICLGTATVLLTAANSREREARQLAQSNEEKARLRFRQAREAVDKFYTQVSDSPEMKAKGVEKLRTKLLQSAVEYYQKFVEEEEGQAPEVQAERANAYHRLGILQNAIGHSSEAEKSYQNELAIWDGLIASRPDLPEYEAGKARSLRSLGSLYVVMGRIEFSEKAHKEALGLRQKLVAEHPEVTAYWNDLAESHHSLGYLYNTTRQSDLAEKSHLEALALRQRLVKEHPEVPAYWDDLGTTHNSLGYLYIFTGRYDQAAKAFQEAVASRKKLSTDYPEVPDYQYTQAISLNNLGNVYMEMGRNDEAEKIQKEGLAIRKKLVAEHPEVSKYQWDLGYSYHNLGYFFSETGRHKQAEEMYKEALAVRKILASKYPEVPDHQSDLAYSYNYLGNLYRDTGRHDQAEKAYQEALALRKNLAAAYPKLPDYQSDVVVSYLDLVFLYQITGRFPKATEMVQEALTTCKRLVAANPTASQYRAILGRCYHNLGIILDEMEQYDLAEKAYLDALKVRKPLAESNPEKPGFRRDVAWSYHNLGVVQRKIGQSQAALKSYQESLALAEALNKSQPEVADYATLLIGSYIGLGDIEQSTGQPTAAIKRYEQAMRTLAPILQKNPNDPDARKFQGAVYAGRAGALELVGRSTEALADWDRAIELSSGKDRDRFRASRVLALIRSGKQERGIAEAEELAKGRSLSGSVLYDLACAAALTSAHYQSKPNKPEATSKAESCALRAIQLLQQARDAGYFKDEKRIAGLKKDSDLEPLRSRPDFQKFLAELEPPVKAK